MYWEVAGRDEGPEAAELPATAAARWKEGYLERSRKPCQSDLAALAPEGSPDSLRDQKDCGRCGNQDPATSGACSKVIASLTSSPAVVPGAGNPAAQTEPASPRLKTIPLIPTDTKQLKASIPRRIGQERRSSDRCKRAIFAVISPNFGFPLRTSPQSWIPASSFQSRSYAVEISGTSPLVVLRCMGWLGKGRRLPAHRYLACLFQPPESPAGQLRNSYQSFDTHDAKLDDCSVYADQEKDDQQERPNWINNPLHGSKVAAPDRNNSSTSSKTMVQVIAVNVGFSPT